MVSLSLKQVECLGYLNDKTTRKILYGGGAGGGKSFLGCYWLVAMATYYGGSRWLMGRAIAKTLKETTLKTFFEVCKLTRIHPEQYQYNAQAGIIRFWNGSEILLKDLDHKPSDPEYNELGSLEISGAFIDEANQITEKGINIVYSRIRFRLDYYGITPKLLMTCNPDKGHLYQNFYRPFVEGELQEDKKFIQALVTDNNFISKIYAENLATLDEISKQRLLYGNWEYDADDMSLVDYNSLLEIFENRYIPSGTKYITCDVARLGKDSTLIIVWDGWRAEIIQRHPKTYVDETVNLIRELMQKFRIERNRVLVDADGVGGGVVDSLKCKSFVNNNRPIPDKNGVIPNFNSLKSQCAFFLADKINKKEIYIPTTNIDFKEMILQELEQLKQKDAPDQRLSLISKEVMKKNISRSPDFLDSIMMRSYFDIQPIGTGNLKINISINPGKPYWENNGFL